MEHGLPYFEMPLIGSAGGMSAAACVKRPDPHSLSLVRERRGIAAVGVSGDLNQLAVDATQCLSEAVGRF